jgi:hypothetical protein
MQQLCWHSKVLIKITSEVTLRIISLLFPLWINGKVSTNVIWVDKVYFLSVFFNNFFFQLNLLLHLVLSVYCSVIKELG